MEQRTIDSILGMIRISLDPGPPLHKYHCSFKLIIMLRMFPNASHSTSQSGNQNVVNHLAWKLHVQVALDYRKELQCLS